MILLLGVENITLCIYGCSAEFSEVLMVPASTATSFHDSGNSRSACFLVLAANDPCKLSKHVLFFLQLPEDIEWHFIGNLQSNKARALLGLY